MMAGREFLAKCSCVEFLISPSVSLQLKRDLKEKIGWSQVPHIHTFNTKRVDSFFASCEMKLIEFVDLGEKPPNYISTHKCWIIQTEQYYQKLHGWKSRKINVLVLWKYIFLSAQGRSADFAKFNNKVKDIRLNEFYLKIFVYKIHLQ